MAIIDGSVLFREPDGPRKGAIFVGLAAVCYGIYGYFLFQHSHRSLLFLALGSVNLLTGLPEFLPRKHARVAGAFRIFNVLFALVVLTLVILQY